MYCDIRSRPAKKHDELYADVVSARFGAMGATAATAAAVTTLGLGAWMIHKGLATSKEGDGSLSPTAPVAPTAMSTSTNPNEPSAPPPGLRPGLWPGSPEGQPGPPEGQPSSILILGDSFAEFSGDSLKEYCPGSMVVNRGVGGSLAADWGASGGGKSTGNCKKDLHGRGPCKASAAFADVPPGVSVSHVLLAVGGNDWVDKGKCNVPRSDIAAVVKSAIDNTLAAAPSIDTKVVMFGYVIPTAIPEECATMSVAELYSNAADQLNGGIADACNNHSSGRCTYVDSMTIAGGTATALSPKCAYHSDVIHLNNRGYCKVFSRQATQAAFACPFSSKVQDCDALDPIVSGAPPLMSFMTGACGSENDGTSDASELDP